MHGTGLLFTSIDFEENIYGSNIQLRTLFYKLKKKFKSVYYEKIISEQYSGANMSDLTTQMWCNPLSLEEIPPGFLAPSRCGVPSRADFFSGPPRDFRELADPEVLYDDGKWYLYASCGGFYVSEDFINWHTEKLLFAGDEKLGYAPTITKCGKNYLLSSSWPYAGKTEILAASAPQGPFRSLGTPVDGDGIPLTPEWLDPMLFTDDDGRLYAYWHFGGEGEGVFGIELDPENPVRGLGKPVKLFDFDPENVFERFGEYNEHTDMSYIEGESMFKHNGEYYLQYAGNGTVYRKYAVGVYRGKSPLGPFTVQRTPAALCGTGLVCGTGHGCWTKGPDNTVWQFYTCLVRRVHAFERRLGMDQVHFDSEGNASVNITSTPQILGQGDSGLLPVSVNKPVSGSSSEGCCYPGFALDDCTHTWWMPEKNDDAPWIETDLRQEFTLSACRIMWAEEGLDFSQGVLPEPAGYKIEFFREKDHAPAGSFDLSGNEKELLSDFRTFAPVRARYARVTLLKTKDPALRRGISNLTLFGRREV